MAATREDADMILKLYDLRREATMRKARKFMIEEFYAADFKDFAAKYVPGTEQHAWFRQVTSYWDMVGAFVSRGVLDAELVFDTGAEFHIVWEKARATAEGIRKERSLPFYLKHLEALASAHKRYIEAQAPGSSAFFASFNRPPAAARA